MKLKTISIPWDVDLLPQRKLVAGQLTCMYEAGNLRNITCGGTEIVKMIYSALRNKDWDTIPKTIFDEKIEVSEKGFFISYTGIYNQDDISYKAYFEIEGRYDNTIHFLMKGEALSTFKKNRIGLCVHHPIKECGGRAVELQHTDGTTSQSVFPQLINPHQPFLNIAGMKWTTADQLHIDLKFEGDTFETEDQRNWTDSSYKTYSTPLSIPYPMFVNKGEKFFQRITLSINAGDRISEKNKKDRVEKIAFPKIGYNRGQVQKNLADAQVIQLQNIPLDHLRLELNLSGMDWVERLQSAYAETKQLNTRLELILFFSESPDNEMDKLIRQLEVVHTNVVSILVLQKGIDVTPPGLLENIYKRIKNSFPALPVGYGTNSHFAELNRNRPPLSNSFDFISFSIQPQVHASDARSIFENLQNQVDSITTAKTFATGKPIHIYISLNGHKSDTGENEIINKTKADPRQNSRFAALWTLLTIQNLGEASKLSFYELTGESGIIASDGQPSPLYEVLAMIKEFEPSWITRRYGEDGLLMDGLLIENKDGEKLFFEATKPVS